MRFDPSARRVLQDLKRLCSVMVSDEEQPSPSEFASLVNDILDPAVSAGPKKKFKPKGLFLGERRDSGAPIDIPSQVLARHAAMLGSTGSGKTVMAKALIEEAALAGIPSLIIDPQGDLARLEFALQQYAVDFLRQRDYTFVQPPVMMNRQAYEGVTDLGDFETVMYGIEPDKYYMIATSEHPLTAMYMDETIPEDQMPMRMVGVSQCFRREVGSHGQSDLGIWRVHQFTKIEQIIIAKPENSWALHEELLQNCTDLWNSLGIHYEVVNICTGDMGTVAAKKYDLEAWIPGANQYKEIVSCSNCTDYQANRLSIRYGQPGHPNQPIVHTLNSTAVATSRALVAIMEQYQLEDGRVAIPEALQPFMGGQSVLEPCNWGCLCR